MDKPIKLSERKKARTYAMQALYQWSLSGSPLNQIFSEFAAHYNMEKVDAPYFNELLTAIPKNLTKVDDAFKVFLDRKLQELNPVELAILRIGSYEILFRPEIPYPVILKEAVSLTRIYGATDGYKYVNGVLDKVAKSNRPHEKYE